MLRFRIVKNSWEGGGNTWTPFTYLAQAIFLFIFLFLFPCVDLLNVSMLNCCFCQSIDTLTCFLCDWIGCCTMYIIVLLQNLRMFTILLTTTRLTITLWNRKSKFQICAGKCSIKPMANMQIELLQLYLNYANAI